MENRITINTRHKGVGFSDYRIISVRLKSDLLNAAARQVRAAGEGCIFF